MLTILQQKHHDRLDELIHLYKYRFHRYGLEFSLIFFYTVEDVDLSSYASLVRLTDSFLKLEDNFYAIVYEGTDIEQSVKAAQNIIAHFERDYQGKTVYVSAVSAKERSDENDMIDQLFVRLGKSIKEKLSSTIVAE
ncbi:MAG: hypothetical protein DRG24_01570 [Epsilonproteobacteria bacterium]|nr:MAG: hypothetical protein DRG24_01570 [Campylobacterota bacterium]